VPAEIYVNDRRANLGARDQRQRFFDRGGGKDAGARTVQRLVKLERDKRLIFHDEHGAPQQRIDGTHDANPYAAYHRERRPALT